MIEMQGIGKTYTRPSGAVEALADVSLTIRPGEFLAIVGSSGSGKTTLLNVLGLLDRPTSGRYILDGEDVTGLGVNEQARLRNRKFGFVFQSFHLLPRVSALENVELPLLYSDRRSIDGLGRRALEAVGLQDRTRHTPAELSGGEQQRVAIARALVNEPELIVADEATGSLDERSALDVLAILQALNRAGRTVVMVTHDARVAAHAKRVCRLERGRIVADESIDAPLVAAEEVK